MGIEMDNVFDFLAGVGYCFIGDFKVGNVLNAVFWPFLHLVMLEFRDEVRVFHHFIQEVAFFKRAVFSKVVNRTVHKKHLLLFVLGRQDYIFSKILAELQIVFGIEVFVCQGMHPKEMV